MSITNTGESSQGFAFDRVLPAVTSKDLGLTSINEKIFTVYP